MFFKKAGKYYHIIKNQKHKGRFLASRILIKLKLSSYLAFKRNGYALIFHPSALTAGLWVNRQERLHEERFLCTLIQAGDTVIDVGANIGTVSLALAQNVGEQGKIFSFEPHPLIYQYLVDNVAFNHLQKTIKTFCTALGKKEDTLYFSNKSDDSSNTISQNGDIEVPVSILDNIVPHQKIKLLKIDVEGYEYQVLLGGKKTCKNTDVIYLECIPEMLAKNNASEEKICTFLSDLGFDIFYTENDTLIPNVIGSHKKKMLLAKKRL